MFADLYPGLRGWCGRGWSGGYPSSLGQVIDRGLADPGGFAHRRWVWSGEFGEAGAQDPVVGAGEEHGVAQAGGVTW